MITPYDAIYQAAEHVDPIVREAHYHLASSDVYVGPNAMQMANFHLHNRNIEMNKIGFDHYFNIVTYRV
ncbi:MAG: hypothetical protein IJD16_01780 [Desulfovibrio sp.]|nr:hypothetical protein [Desulfovibrio sp.]